MSWYRSVVYFKRETSGYFLTARAILGASCLALGLLACPDQSHAQSLFPQAAPPPVVWAIPIQGGPIEVLFVGPEAAAADFEHLQRRLQLKTSRVTFPFATDAGGARETRPLLDEPALGDLRRALEKPPHVVVLARIGMDDLPAPLRQRLRSLAEAGTGLVLVSYGPDRSPAPGELFEGLGPKQDSEVVTRGIGAGALAGWQDGLDRVHLYEGERGRAVAIAYWSNAPQTHCLVPAAEDDVLHAPGTIDNYLSLVARAVRWAAGRDPELRIEKVESMTPPGPDAVDTPPQLPAEFIQNMRDAAAQPLLRPYRLRLNRPAKKKYTVRVRARYPYRGLESSYTPDDVIGRGEQSIILNLPVGYGDCFLDFWLLDRGVVVDWFTEAVRHEGWPEITNVVFSSLAVEPNDTIEISLRVRPHYHRPRPCTVFVRATDSLGRLVAETSVPVDAKGGEITVELPLVDLLAPYLKVEVFAADTKEGPLNHWLMERSDYAFAHVLVRRNAPNGFRFITDGPAATEFNTRRHNRTMAAYGIDAIHMSDPADPVGVPALDHLDAIPTVASYAIPASYEDPDTRSNQDYELGEQTRRYRQFGPGLYLLDIENISLGEGASASNAGLYAQEFQRFLAAKYPGLTALNRAWGTAFDDWSEARSAAIRGPRSTSAHMDLDAFEESMLLTAYLRAGDVISEIDPRARVGIEAIAPGKKNYALDSATFLRRVDFLLVSDDPLAADKVQSFRSDRGMAILKPAGGLLARGVRFAEWLPWYAALHGLDGLWIDSRAGTMIGRGPGDGAKKHAPEDPLSALAREVRVVQSGIAALLKQARPVRSGIAIYDSRSSTRLDRVVPVNAYASRTSQESFARLLDKFGYQYDFVDYEAVVKGALADYSLCVLPFARALSSEEIFALQRFHREGGALIADILPGRYDEHGSPREENPLRRLFGVSSHGQLRLGPIAPISLKEDPKRGRRRRAAAPVRPDRSIYGSNAGILATVDETAIGFVRVEAAGRTLLLNYCLGNSPNELEPAISEWVEKTGATKKCADALLSRGNFSGDVSVFKFSEATLYTFLKRPDEKDTDERVRIVVESDRHAYDVLTGRHYGPGSKASLKVTPGRAALLCSLPYEVTRVVVAASKVVGRGRRLSIHAEIKTRGGLPQDHVVHVAITAPDGSTMPHYARVLDCPNGRCETYIPLAINDAPGQYTVTVRDVLTGTVGHAEVIVR